MTVRRVLICEDSRTYAAGLSRLLERDPEIDIVGVCSTAEQALARLPQLKPDLVTMDLELPGMSGVEAIEQIMGAAPVPILVLSGHVNGASETAISALAAGALEALPKASVDLADFDGPNAVALRRRVKLLSGVPVIRHPRARLRERAVPASWKRVASVIGIVASTGGPPALAKVLASLPDGYPIPILVVQHIAAGFVEGFATWLDGQVALPVRVAADQAKLAPGVWIAPEGAHLTLNAANRLILDRETVSGPHRPSGDVLLASLAGSAGRAAVGVVLTGMGRDGALGVEALREAGGFTIAQDEASSAVFGMPRAAADRGADTVLALEDIGSRLIGLRPPAGGGR